MSKEHMTTAIAVVITVLVTWLITKGTDQFDAGGDAQTRNIVQEEIEAAMVTDSGLTISQEIQQAKVQRATIMTNQQHILDAVRELSRE